MRAQSHVEEIVSLRRRLDEALEENRYLKALMTPDRNAAGRLYLGLQPQEWLLLDIMRSMSPAPAAYEQLIARVKSRSDDPLGLIKQRTYSLRNKLRRHRISIRTVYGEGICLDVENKERLDALLSEKASKAGGKPS
ncbi:MAG: hypothetical protein KGZ68_10985 [Dechloromonas sp.]|nr:hypothetical protein [Dechloromonas sp.]